MMKAFEGKYLPIGKVVMLKRDNKRIKATSFFEVSQDKPEKMLDYGGYVECVE